MEILIFLWALSLPVAALVYLFGRLRKLDRRIDRLSRELAELKGGSMESPLLPSLSSQPVAVAVEQVAPESIPAQTSAHHTDWESLIGGDWLNKLGMSLLVIGIALTLGYSFTRVGPAGRIATSLVVSFGMLLTGVFLERRERYSVFGRGLIGGGWAALYFTVYAMYALEAARILRDPFVAAVLLFAVAAGMIIHALRYRSQAVTGLAYFIAFATLDITEITTFSIVALIPLAASLLYIARRFAWPLFARLGMVATYATCALRGDSGSPLWATQGVFAIYWLLFEGFDLFSPDPWLVPLNGTAFLTLSGLKWESAAPGHMWQLSAVGAGGFLVDTILRARSGRWRSSITFVAGLAAGAILLRSETRWAPYWLLAEGELFYLAGLRFREPYLRYLGGIVLAIEALQIGWQVGPSHTELWIPAAVLSAACFYANRVLRASDVVYGYAGAAMVALALDYGVPQQEIAVSWMAAAAAAFLLGYWRKMPDFYHQALALAGLAFVASWVDPALEAGIVILGLYGVQLLLNRGGRLRILFSLMATVRLAALLHQQVSGSLLTVAWAAEGLLLLAAGFPLRDRILRLSGMALFAGCVLKLFAYDLRNLDTLPRIISFIVLGMILVSVSWIYTRFREQLQRYL